MAAFILVPGRLNYTLTVRRGHLIGLLLMTTSTAVSLAAAVAIVLLLRGWLG